jgi:hypothetical protein
VVKRLNGVVGHLIVKGGGAAGRNGWGVVKLKMDWGMVALG